jgi:hypothetical protein
MLCTRTPGSRPGRKRQAMWRAEGTYHSVVALMDHLRCESIQRLVHIVIDRYRAAAAGR